MIIGRLKPSKQGSNPVAKVLVLSESLVDATNFVRTVETHQHRKIACLEEIAYLNGWITKEDVLKVYEVLKKNQYGQYLKDILDGKYIDVISEVK